MWRTSEEIKSTMLANAAGLRRLYARINETFASRDKSAEFRREWSDACAEFYASYDKLAFPAGRDAIGRIAKGEAHAMEAAICFLECRPYLFRSGYIFTTILRRAKRAPLSPEQSSRLQLVIAKRAAWRARMKAGE
jgi:hypothetical protein